MAKDSASDSDAKPRKKERKVSIHIGDNLLTWEGVLIQISNIESIDYLIAPPPKYPEKASLLKDEGKAKERYALSMAIGAAILCLLGAVMLGSLFTLGTFLFISGLIFAWNSFSLFKESRAKFDEAKKLVSGWKELGDIAEQIKYLYIRTNSGTLYPLHFSNNSDLRKAHAILAAVIENGGKPTDDAKNMPPAMFVEQHFHDNRSYRTEVSGGTVEGNVGHTENH